MNEMAMVEYLLKKYAEYSAKAKKAEDEDYVFDYEHTYYSGEARMARDIIVERFGMKIRETFNEYIAENSVCSIRVKRHRQGE